MSNTKILSVGVALATLGLATFAHAERDGTAAPTCEIRASATQDGVNLEGTVSGKPGSAGDYTFALEKIGAGGNSSVNQGGEFEIDSSGAQTVTATELNLDRHDAYRATMILNTRQRTARCELDYRDGRFQSFGTGDRS
ncbi:MAG: hypothetical protein HY243_15490 [Proteobacteria bacterium]|nr:hypothetical protein [Pseudomonadota bacterium]